MAQDVLEVFLERNHGARVMLNPDLVALNPRFRYEPENGEKVRGERRWGIKVFLDGKLVGRIRSVATGYQYAPKGHRWGEAHLTLSSLKADLEAK
jgi:hypothetical protein